MIDRKQSKLKGDIAETRVLCKLLELGYTTLKPTGDRVPYDLAIDCGDGRMIRIQVKGSFTTNHNRAICSSKSRCMPSGNYRLRKYSDDAFDFAILLDSPTNTFWVVPFNEFVSRRAIPVNPNKKIFKYAEPTPTRKYIEAWHLLEEFMRGSVRVAHNSHEVIDIVQLDAPLPNLTHGKIEGTNRIFNN